MCEVRSKSVEGRRWQRGRKGLIVWKEMGRWRGMKAMLESKVMMEK
jgi:hypothetical protein